MAVSKSFQLFIKEQLSNIEGATYRKMFGGIGIFKEKIMFGMISSQNVFYLRTDKTNVSLFEAYGKENFNPMKKGNGMPYHEIPEEILENSEKLVAWSQISYEVALNNKKK